MVDDVIKEEVGDRGDFSRCFSGAKSSSSEDGCRFDGNRSAVNRSRGSGGGRSVGRVANG